MIGVTKLSATSSGVISLLIWMTLVFCIQNRVLNSPSLYEAGVVLGGLSLLPLLGAVYLFRRAKSVLDYCALGFNLVWFGFLIFNLYVAGHFPAQH